VCEWCRRVPDLLDGRRALSVRHLEHALDRERLGRRGETVGRRVEYGTITARTDARRGDTRAESAQERRVRDRSRGVTFATPPCIRSYTDECSCFCAFCSLLVVLRYLRLDRIDRCEEVSVRAVGVRPSQQLILRRTQRRRGRCTIEHMHCKKIHAE
jgi:hypothetical protein